MGNKGPKRVGFKSLKLCYIYILSSCCVCVSVMLVMSSVCLVTYMVAECRLDSLMSVVFLDGESSSTGEMKPSASSSM